MSFVEERRKHGDDLYEDFQHFREENAIRKAKAANGIREDRRERQRQQENEIAFLINRFSAPSHHIAIPKPALNFKDDLRERSLQIIQQDKETQEKLDQEKLEREAQMRREAEIRQKEEDIQKKQEEERKQKIDQGRQEQAAFPFHSISMFFSYAIIVGIYRVTRKRERRGEAEKSPPCVFTTREPIATPPCFLNFPTRSTSSQ